MKFNKQKIEEIKNKLTNIREKTASTHKEKVSKKYYALLVLMLLLGMITLSNNIKVYNKSKQETYTEYELEKEQEVDNSNVEIERYKTDQSSISTNISTIEEEAVETISSNKAEQVNESKYIMPIAGDIIKEFAVEKLVYSATLGMWKTHPGIDIEAELETEVKSASEGTVQMVESDNFYGNIVKILDSEGYTFVYGNLDNNINLNKGDRVNKGDIIGKVGVSASGELADESHLHFEVINDEVQVNPLDLIN